jgi:YVTN family beta-propeller protein
MAYDSGKGEIFATNLPPNNSSNPNASSNTISVISDNSNTAIATITVGSNPQGIAYDSGKNEIFVTNSDSQTISIISDKSNSVIKTLLINGYPFVITYDSGKGELFFYSTNATGLANPFTTVITVSVISDSTNTIIANITAGGGGQAYDSGKGEVFAASSFTGTVSIISDASSTSASPTPATSVSQTPTVLEFSAVAIVLVLLLMVVVSVCAVALVSKKIVREPIDQSYSSQNKKDCTVLHS